MMPNLDDVIRVLTTIGILGSWFHYVALRPLKITIDTLQVTINELKRAVDLSMQDRRELAQEIAEVRILVKEAHRRIDNHEKNK